MADGERERFGARAALKTMTMMTVAAKVNVPRVPNFLITEYGFSMPVSAFTEDDLRNIGAQWVENLVARAKEQAATEDELERARR